MVAVNSLSNLYSNFRVKLKFFNHHRYFYIIYSLNVVQSYSE